MGWQSDDGKHEGYIVGLFAHTVGNRHFLRELLPGIDDALIEAKMDGHQRVHVDAVQIACTCGWRSRAFVAPGIEFSSWLVTNISDNDRELMHDMWEHHLAEKHPQGWSPYSDVKDWWLSSGVQPSKL